MSWIACEAVHDAAADGLDYLYPALEPFVQPYRIVASAGLGLTCHAAEAGQAAARRAVELLG